MKRLTVMSQMTRGLRSRDNPKLAAEVLEELTRLKWFLWHGNVFRALQTVDDLQIDLDNTEHPSIEQQKLLKTVTEFGGYIRPNGAWIPNDGERYRSGEAISNAFVESTVNQVVSKRMVKKQQMRWSQRGAHLLLQIRTRVLNDDLAGYFRRWYATFMPASERQDVAAWSPTLCPALPPAAMIGRRTRRQASLQAPAGFGLDRETPGSLLPAPTRERVRAATTRRQTPPIGRRGPTETRGLPDFV